MTQMTHTLKEQPASAGAVAVRPDDHPSAFPRRLRSGDLGVLPAFLGLVVLAAIFEALNSNFLTAGNLVNLMVQGAIYMLLAMGMIFVLLIGEIDLSIGFVGGVSGVVAAVLIYGNSGLPWWIGLAAGLTVGALIGILNGLIITVVGLPSFVVTLAGLLGWNGVMLMILGNGGTVPINDHVINGLANDLLPPVYGWLVMSVLVAVYALDTIVAEKRRRQHGNIATPVNTVTLKIVGVAVAGSAIVGLCNVNRGRLAVVEGVPYLILIVLGFLVLWTILLKRTPFGTYIYAIGGNAEAARRAGIRVDAVRVWVFGISGFMGGVAGMVYASRMRSVSTNLDGGSLVLYCIAAAVIGGTSLFGGRGKVIHAILARIIHARADFWVASVA